MNRMTVKQESVTAEVGQSVRLQLPDGRIIAGTVTRIDDRTLRLRPAGRGGLIVVAHPAVTVLGAAGDLAA